MTRRARILAVALWPALGMLASCGSGVDATGATASEARQLNDAAAAMDVNSIDINAVDPAPAQQDQ